MARTKAASDQAPIPVFGSGVMLVELTVPKGVWSGRPPASARPPGAVWQTTQSPRAARPAPRWISAGRKALRGGGATGAIAGLALQIRNSVNPARSTTAATIRARAARIPPPSADPRRQVGVRRAAAVSEQAVAERMVAHHPDEIPESAKLFRSIPRARCRRAGASSGGVIEPVRAKCVRFARPNGL